MASNHASLATRTRYTRLDLERPRRCACGVAALAVAASLAAVAALAASPLARSGGVVAAWRTDSAAASSEPAARPRGAVSGAATGVQFVVRGEAQQVVRSVGGWLNYTLDVTEGVFLLPRGISFATRLYNGVSPAPLLLARPGDRIRLRLRNRLGPDVASPNDGKGNGLRQANTTNLHLHGIYADAVSDDTFTRVSPGQEKLYEYLLHPQTGSSLLFYHPHADGSTWVQMYGGMAGGLLIEDEAQEEALGLPVAASHVALLQALDFRRSSESC